jgi:hypothetical protein
MEWIKDEESGGEHAVIKVGGRAVWSAVVVTNGESWVPCIVRDAPGGGADVLWPPDPDAATHCPSIEAAKKAAGEVLAQWGRNLIGMGEPSKVEWATLTGGAFMACIMGVHLAVRQAGRAWAASVEGRVVCYCDSADLAKETAETAARKLLRGGQ